MVEDKYSRTEFMMNMVIIFGILYFSYKVWSSVKENSLFFLFLFIILFSFLVRAILKRLNDIDISAFHVLFIFIPFLNILFLIFLLFYPGIDDKDPPLKTD